MNIAEFLGSSGEWLSGTGPEHDVVVSTRIRLARNISGFPFHSRASDKDKAAILSHILERIRETPLAGSLHFFDVEGAEPVDRLFLVERHLISKELASSEGERSVGLEPDEIRSIMINEEDHLRIQILRSGLQIDKAWDDICRIDEVLDESLEYAFNAKFGYLTACPTNAGTGMRASVMFHLPALVLTKQIEKVWQAVSKINMAVRGLYGEGTEAHGGFFQISNQVTLGISEEEILTRIKKVVPKIIEYERNVRDTIEQESRQVLEDRVHRALGTLRSARTIQSEETLNLLSTVRLGVHMRLIDDLPLTTINELFLQCQPAHIQKIEGRILEQEERDVARADFIRKRLN